MKAMSSIQCSTLDGYKKSLDTGYRVGYVYG